MARSRQQRSPLGKASVGTALVLMAVGGVVAFAVEPSDQVAEYVELFDLGLILIWSGILLMAAQVWMHRPQQPRRRRPDEGPDQWYEHDVHRPGYEGQTQRFPTVRDR
jgi:hypothetical protein